MATHKRNLPVPLRQRPALRSALGILLVELVVVAAIIAAVTGLALFALQVG